MAGVFDEWKYITSYLGVQHTKINIDKTSGVPVLKTKNGLKLLGAVSIVKYLCRNSKREHLLGENIETSAAIDQWLEYRDTHLDRCSTEKELHQALRELSTYLADKVYFIGQSISLADVFMYYGLVIVFNDLTFYDKQKYLHLSRWYDNTSTNSRLCDKKTDHEPLGRKPGAPRPANLPKSHQVSTGQAVTGEWVGPFMQS